MENNDINVKVNITDGNKQYSDLILHINGAIIDSFRDRNNFRYSQMLFHSYEFELFAIFIIENQLSLPELYFDKDNDAFVILNNKLISQINKINNED